VTQRDRELERDLVEVADLVEHRADDVAHVGDAFFEMSLDLLCVAGFDGYFKRLNPAWTRTLGWTPEELISRPTIELVHPDDRAGVLAARGRLAEGAPLRTLANRYLCKDGTYRWLEWRSVAHLDRGLVYGAARDVTEEVQAKEQRDLLQRQLMFADRMASVGTLAAGAAHEINNPLAYVTANLDLVIEELAALGGTAPTAAQLAEWTAMAVEAREGTERIRKIVRGLTSFSRTDPERLRVLDLTPTVELACKLAFNEIRQRARLVKDFGEIPRVEADDSQLGQVFLNLLVNAAQAIPEGETEVNEIRVVTTTDAQGRAVIEVRDTGSGIPDHVIGRVFDPFFTTKPVGVGTGLGLSICHNIVTRLGGEITLHRGDGRGTIVRVVIPAAAARSEPAPVAATTVLAPTKRRRAVLIVDDERAVGVALGRALREHDVTVVTSAKEALDLIVSKRPFDVILSDLMMPGMSGMDLYDELAGRYPQVAERMVFITGGAFTPDGIAFLERVPNQRLEKPFDAATVRTLVQQFGERT